MRFMDLHGVGGFRHWKDGFNLHVKLRQSNPQGALQIIFDGTFGRPFKDSPDSLTLLHYLQEIGFVLDN
jgi:hypothetical protein